MVAERIRAAVAKIKITDSSKTVTVSIGVTICDDTGENEISAGLQRADESLYRAKHSGRNRIVAYETEPVGVDIQHTPIIPTA